MILSLFLYCVLILHFSFWDYTVTTRIELKIPCCSPFSSSPSSWGHCSQTMIKDVYWCIQLPYDSLGDVAHEKSRKKTDSVWVSNKTHRMSLDHCWEGHASQYISVKGSPVRIVLLFLQRVLLSFITKQKHMNTEIKHWTSTNVGKWLIYNPPKQSRVSDYFVQLIIEQRYDDN